MIVFAYLGGEMPKSPQGPYQTVGKVLRWTGLAGLVIFGLAILRTVISMILVLPGMEATRDVIGHPDPSSTAAAFASGILLIVWQLALAFGFLFWVGWTYQAWVAKKAAGRISVIILGAFLAFVALIALPASAIGASIGADHFTWWVWTDRLVDMLRAIPAAAAGIALLVGVLQPSISKTLTK